MRNLGEVYKGLYHMMRREIKEAATQFLGALATFTATEIVVVLGNTQVLFAHVIGLCFSLWLLQRVYRTS